MLAAPRYYGEFPGMNETQKPTAREIWSNEALRVARTNSGFKIRIGEIERRLDCLRHLLAARDASIQEEACISETLFRPASLPSLGSIDDLGRESGGCSRRIVLSLPFAEDRSCIRPGRGYPAVVSGLCVLRIGW
ncbi:MAG: hypothetical protein ACRD4F_14945 [Candidatus Angelobacter sp.]